MGAEHEGQGSRTKVEPNPAALWQTFAGSQVLRVEPVRPPYKSVEAQTAQDSALLLA